MQGKSIRRDDLEGAFEDLLQDLQPSETAHGLIKDMFKVGWELRGQQVKDAAKVMSRKFGQLEGQIAALLERVVEASSPRVISAYEAKIDALEKEKLIVAEKLENAGQIQRPFEEMFELACQFLSSPWKIWRTGHLAMRRVVLKLAFEERIAYCRKEGLRTPKTTLPFNA